VQQQLLVPRLSVNGPDVLRVRRRQGAYVACAGMQVRLVGCMYHGGMQVPQVV
jgi:hypothetical protein